MLKKLLPPGLIEPEEGAEQVVQTPQGPLPVSQVGQVIQEMGMALQNADRMLDQAKMLEEQNKARQLEIEQQRLRVEMFNAETKRLEAEAKRLESEVAARRAAAEEMQAQARLQATGQVLAGVAEAAKEETLGAVAAALDGGQGHDA